MKNEAFRIGLQQAGKRYRREWVFRNLNAVFESGTPCAVTGPNGSGKSTLVQVLSGISSLSAGKISFSINGKNLPVEAVWRHVGVVAPYADLIEEFTLEEAIQFHLRFKPLQENYTGKHLLDALQLPNNARTKLLREFSSGMKQRVKLALALFSDTSLLLLDEPTITLDKEGVAWYERLLMELSPPSRLLIIASNVAEDFIKCDQKLNIADYKSI